MALITAQEISGASVYGIPQMSYTVGGQSGKDYGAAVAVATLVQANAFEMECNALAAMTRVRMRKLDDLGEALAIISRVMANMKVKKPQSKDTVTDSDLPRAKSLMAKYGLELKLQTDKNGNDLPTIRRDNASYAQNDVQYAMDREDNDLQQDLVTVQGTFSKRDNAFSTASKLIGKVNNAAQSIIGNFGG